MSLEVWVSKGEFGTYRVTLSGSLDTLTAPKLDRALAEAYADPEARAIRFELQELSFISSMGIGVVVKARKLMHARGGVVSIVGAQPQVQRIFEIVRVLPRETVFASVEEADAYFEAIQRKVLEEHGGNGMPLSGSL